MKGELIMPYVLQERRPALDPVVEKMVALELTTRDIEAFLIYLAVGRYDQFMSILEISRGRRPIDEFRPLLEAVKTADVKSNGDLNYILFKYCRYHIKPSYNNYKTYIGCIYRAMDKIDQKDYIDEYREAAAEIRRRILSPYEDGKIKQNGDV
jgi:hypothetical protein